MNLQRFTSSLVTRLIVFGVLIVIFGVVMRYVLLSRFLRQDLIQVVSAQQLALAEYVAGDIDYTASLPGSPVKEPAARLAGETGFVTQLAERRQSYAGTGN